MFRYKHVKKCLKSSKDLLLTITKQRQFYFYLEHRIIYEYFILNNSN